MQDRSIELSNSIYNSYQANEKQFFIKSKQGKIDLNFQDIRLSGEIEARIILKNNTYIIEAKTLKIDPINQSVVSEEKVKFKTRNFVIVSLGLNVSETSKKGMTMLFEKALFDKIDIENLKSSIYKGKANKIEFFPDKNLILMEGEAELYQDNMKISSDEIHYDLNQDKILKSIKL